MSQIPLSDIPEEHQKFLEEVRVRLQVLHDNKAELQEFIDSRTSWSGENSLDPMLRGQIEYVELGIAAWGFGSERKTVQIEDFWYASDQDC